MTYLIRTEAKKDLKLILESYIQYGELRVEFLAKMSDEMCVSAPDETKTFLSDVKTAEKKRHTTHDAGDDYDYDNDPEDDYKAKLNLFKENEYIKKLLECYSQHMVNLLPLVQATIFVYSLHNVNGSANRIAHNVTHCIANLLLDVALIDAKDVKLNNILTRVAEVIIALYDVSLCAAQKLDVKAGALAKVEHKVMSSLNHSINYMFNYEGILKDEATKSYIEHNTLLINQIKQDLKQHIDSLATRDTSDRSSKKVSGAVKILFGVSIVAELLTLPIAIAMLLNVTNVVSLPKLSIGSPVGDIGLTAAIAIVAIVVLLCIILSAYKAFKKILLKMTLTIHSSIKGSLWKE